MRPLKTLTWYEPETFRVHSAWMMFSHIFKKDQSGCFQMFSNMTSVKLTLAPGKHNLCSPSPFYKHILRTQLTLLSEQARVSEQVGVQCKNNVAIWAYNVSQLKAMTFIIKQNNYIFKKKNEFMFVTFEFLYFKYKWSSVFCLFCHISNQSLCQLTSSSSF